MSPIHNRSGRFDGFHLPLGYVLCVFYKSFTNLGLIYMFFRSGSDFRRPMGNLLGSLLKYNALEDFEPGSLLDDFKEVFQTTSKKSSNDFQQVF
ncbi:hypothetical protein Bca4012_032541 [Brassica carinata]|uniref:Uncharacterized protein n=1 Tax=Brassica cretica TaxID=69181 RepID=A0A8S9QUL9_BRACR|nr:hypothetical protein F2Q69_00016173 [Brassica cretica]